MRLSRATVVLIIFLVAGSFFVGFLVGARKNFSSPEVREDISQSTVSVMFDYGNDTSDVFDLTIPGEGASLFEILKSALESEMITLEYKDYGGELGVFIQSINDFAGGVEYYWQYWVNNRFADVGVSSFSPKPGDVILFKLAKSQF
jgi:hypothetical protein